MNYPDKTVKQVVAISILTALLSFVAGYWIGLKDCL
jgi:uncharacterized membrane protein